MATKKTATKKAAKKPAKNPAKNPGGDQTITIRMYRQGLGDCFLLRFPGNDGDPFWMMIDFGIILGTPGPQPIMESVLKNIIATTGGTVNVLVATHEHWDH